MYISGDPIIQFVFKTFLVILLNAVMDSKNGGSLQIYSVLCDMVILNSCWADLLQHKSHPKVFL